MRPPSLNEQQRFGLLHPVHDVNAWVRGLCPETSKILKFNVNKKLAKISYVYFIILFI
jgi:hypothetical protein